MPRPTLPRARAAFSWTTPAHAISRAASSAAARTPRPRRWPRYAATSAAAALAGALAYGHVSERVSPRTPPAEIFRDVPREWAFDVLETYRNHTLGDLVNAYTVLGLCRVKVLVENAQALLDFAKAVGMSSVANWVIRNTFYKHFCGGETRAEVTRSMDKLRAVGLGPIVDLSIESENEAETSDWRDWSDYVVLQLKESVDLAAVEQDSFIAVKLTAVAPPALLQKLTTFYNTARARFNEADTDKDGLLSRKEFAELYRQLFKSNSSAAADKAFTAIDDDRDGSIHMSEFLAHISLSNPEAKANWRTQQPQQQQKPFLTPTDVDNYAFVESRLHSLCTHAYERRVKIFIDAEQTWFQGGIDDFALSLSRVYNRPTPANTHGTHLVFNTYQLYLRDSYSRMVADFEGARRRKYAFCAKLVRGAYMKSERKRAADAQRSDPVHGSIDETHDAYNAGVAYIINEMSRNFSTDARASTSTWSWTSWLFGGATIKPTTHMLPSFVVASHNQHSIYSTCRAIECAPEPLRSLLRDKVYFAQLMGMKDYVSLLVDQRGFKSYKYIPYGPIEHTIPYLLRRMQENAAILEKSGEDVDVLKFVIWKRLFA